jgi:hypothetical protein
VLLFRKVLAGAALIALLALRFEVPLWKFLFIDRTTAGPYFANQADHTWSEYVRFVEGVREHTPEGAKIAFVVPTMTWDSGYSYAYYRASYFLPQREVLPLIWSDDSHRTDSLAAAEYLGLWRVDAPSANGRVVWQGDGGVLLKR